VAVLAAVPPAQAELVGQFDAGLRNIKASGSYTVVASGRVYETSGDPPPLLETALIHFPRGAALRSRFLVPHFFCDGSKLLLKPDPALCRSSHFAKGTMTIDARPAIADAFGVSVDLFLAEGGENGSTASVVVLVRSNDLTPFYDYEVLKGYLFKGSTAGKRFGYRLQLPTTLHPFLPEVTLRLAEFRLKMRGLFMKRRSRKIFWIRTPHCPRSKKVSFGADYTFAGRAPIAKRKRVSCRRFIENPSLHRGGQIPVGQGSRFRPGAGG
jgi:hypothetical protein